MLKNKPLRIATIIQHLFCDNDFGKALSSICQGPEDDFLSGGLYSIAKFEFTFINQPIFFLRNHQLKAEDIGKHILSISHGVIVSLSGLALDIRYLTEDDVYVPVLKDYVKVVCDSKLPIVFAVEDMKNSNREIDMPIYEGNINDEYGYTVIDSRPASTLNLQDDIWQPTSPTMQAIREILKVPDEIPLLPYSHDKPASIENILKTLLAKIENQAQ